LLGFVYDPHAAAADFAQQSVIAEPLQERVCYRDRRSGEAPGDIVGSRLEVLDEAEDREKLADLAGHFRITRDIFVQCGSLATPAPLEELFGEFFDRRPLW
jgi:hypothetical protein